MPATPTTPRTPSTRISRRTSSRSVASDDQPSTSSAAPTAAVGVPDNSSNSTPTSSTSNPVFASPGIPMETEETVETEETPTTSTQKAPSDGEEEDEADEVVVKEKTPRREKRKDDQRVAYIVSLLLTKNRKIHDKLVASIGPGTSDDKAISQARIKPVVDQIQLIEQFVLKKSLEDVLQDPKYAVLADLSKPPEAPRQPEKPVVPAKTMHPIEVKIDESDEANAPSTSVMPSAAGAPGENNVERAAKREAHVLARIAELRKNGLWSNSRLPKCVEPERNKTHWDYLLEEVKWMATDFRAETNHKRRVAKAVAHAIAKRHRDKQAEAARAAEREIKEKKRMCAGVAKMVKEFWQGVDKLVDFRANEIRTARLRKAKNKHLMFVLGQVDGISSIVQDGLVASKSPSIASHDNDEEFDVGSGSEEDDEKTIAKAEKSLKKDDIKKEVDALQDEAGGDMDDFLTTLPPEYLEKVYGISPEHLEAMKQAKRETEERRKAEKEAAENAPPKVEEVVGEDEKMEVDEAAPTTSEDRPSTSAEKSPEDVEKLQDTSAEDGNGDGRGVLQNVDYTKLNSVDSDERQQELTNIAEEALKFQPKGYTLETTQVKTQVPFLIRGTLREYQMVGLDWMVTLYEKNLNGILADEMGLGKTIQTISLLAHLACSESIWGPHLIVVPTSVILNWEMEFKKWCPALKILTYFGTAKERAEKRKGWMKPNCFHVCITSYKTVTQDIRSFKQRAWQYLILDEAQNIKNWKSQRWQALLNVRARRRLLLTGTPLQNSLMELWSLMHFLMPTIFSSHDDFKDWFSNPLTGMMEGSMEYNAPLIGRLHKVLRPFILRRLKKEVEKQLPEKTEHVIKCSLSKRQRYLYDDFMSRRSTKDNLKSGNMMSVLNIVMQLRKCCNHPNLFEPRPVVAPFVVPKLQMDVPAYLFDIAHQNPAVPEIPDIFNLNKVGYQPQSTGIYNSRKPLIEELEGMQTNILHEQRVPEVDGFRFNRTAFVMKNPHHPRAGEESEDEGVRGNGVNGVHLSNGSASSNGANVNGTSSTSASIRPQTSSFIRSKTVLNPAPLTITTDRSGFHFNMANHGRSRLDDNARLSPPLKRAKLTGAPINWSDYVPQHVIEKMEVSRKNQLQIVRRRFGMVRAPIIPLEMVALIREEILTEFPQLVTDEEASVQERLMDYVELLVQRFGMYVEPVLTDAWQCRPSSSGLPSFIRSNIAEVETGSRTLLMKSSSQLDTQMSIARSLQFPELRLIEYDCGKLQTLALLLRQLYIYKHRCLIFTQMSKMLDVLQTFLSHHGYQYFRLDGTTGVEQRQAMMERFNADSKVFCFILSTRSGGVGVNLTGADTVIFYDSDWNPTMDAQAQDRCHRIGQTRNVSIYRLISERTIEENILKKATQKRRLGELAIDEAGFTPEFFKQTDNIRDLFDGENVEVTAPEDVPMNEKDMEKAMAKCEDEADVNAAKVAVAEARVDNAEFDERIPTGGASSLAEEEADEKYMELIQAVSKRELETLQDMIFFQLKPIERYAVNLLETAYKPEFEEECKEAEAQINQKRDEWDKNLNELAFENDPNGERMFGEDTADDDFYLNQKAQEEVRKKRQAASIKRASKLLPRARSPSKRKSLAPSQDPYISYAPHALSSPPDSPIRKKAPRRSSVAGGGSIGGASTSTAGRGRPPGRKSLSKRVTKKEESEEPEEPEDDEFDDNDDEDEDDLEYSNNRRSSKPVKRKRVAFAEPVGEPKKKAQKIAPNTPRPPPRQTPSSGLSSLTTLPEQGPLTFSAPSAPSDTGPSTSTTHVATPRPARVPYQSQPQHQKLLPVKVVKVSPSTSSSQGPSKSPTTSAMGPPTSFRRIVPSTGAGNVGRLPIRLPSRIPAPIQQGNQQQTNRQYVLSNPTTSSNVPRIRVMPPGTRPTQPATGSQAPKMMYPVRVREVFQRPAPPVERPGFGIYEKPRFSLGSRRSRGESMMSDAPSTSSAHQNTTPRPPQPPPPAPKH
ncbi:CRE-SSL-1 protein [Caenorhabditis remanei]|uniref:CRE-SSL-1 protein n=1 Tax=Caenorhabditis remanei TaxID=31234 RepID=E3LWK6_CAERE|nr:CRE-SSL-1 protein [Caenorhabditis remanei]